MRTILVGAVLLLILTFAACSLPSFNVGISAPPELAPTPTPIATCPDIPPAGLQLLTNERDDYCVLYPSGFALRDPLDSEIVLVGPAPSQGTPAQVFIDMEPATGRTADLAAEEILANVQTDLPGLQVNRSETTIAGEAAVILEPMPGQEMSRQVVVTHEDRLYRLTFTPADPNAATFAQMEDLYGVVMRSLRFLPSPAFGMQGTVAFVRNDTLYVQEADLGRPALPVDDCVGGNCHILHPVWSPDGSRLLYIRSGVEITGPAQVLTVDRNGAVRAEIGVTGQLRPAAWSPDGASVAFLRPTDRMTNSADGAQEMVMEVVTVALAADGAPQEAQVRGEVGYGLGCGGGGRSESALAYEGEGGYAYGYLAGALHWTPGNLLLYSTNCTSRGVGRFDLEAGAPMAALPGDIRSLTLDAEGRRWAGIDGADQLVVGRVDRDGVTVLRTEETPVLAAFGPETGRLFYTGMAPLSTEELVEQAARLSDAINVSPYFDFVRPTLHAYDPSLRQEDVVWSGNAYAYARMTEAPDGSLLFSQVEDHADLFAALRDGKLTVESYRELLPQVDVLRLAPARAAPARWLAGAQQFAYTPHPVE